MLGAERLVDEASSRRRASPFSVRNSLRYARAPHPASAARTRPRSPRRASSSSPAPPAGPRPARPRPPRGGTRPSRSPRSPRRSRPSPSRAGLRRRSSAAGASACRKVARPHPSRRSVSSPRSSSNAAVAGVLGDAGHRATEEALGIGVRLREDRRGGVVAQVRRRALLEDGELGRDVGLEREEMQHALAEGVDGQDLQPARASPPPRRRGAGPRRASARVGRSPATSVIAAADRRRPSPPSARGSRRCGSACSPRRPW